MEKPKKCHEGCTNTSIHLFGFLSSPKLTLFLVCILSLLYSNLRLIARVNPRHKDGSDLPVEHLLSRPPRLNAANNDDDTYNNNNKNNYNDGSYSACLLIMDDNHRLAEWLAYHYFVANVRYIVVAVDPASRTSPETIWQPWHDMNNLTIVQWTDDDFTERNLIRQADQGDKLLHGMHRARQWTFYNACTKHLKDRNRTWTLYIDTDEYVTINESIVPDAQERLRQEGSIPRLLQELRNDVNGTMEQSFFYQQNRTCYTIPRRLYSAVESSPAEIAQGVPAGFDPMRFDTLRFRYRADPPTQRNGYCKSILDASAVPDKLLGWDRIAGTAHRPIRRICPSQYVEYVFPIGIHHYMGSLESFTYRDDARKNNFKSATTWDKYAHLQQGGVDDEIRPWLEGFVNLVGPEKASVLLQGVGVLQDKKALE